MSQQLDRNELKVQALLEKVSSLTAEKENQIADLRVEVTLLSSRLQELEAEAQAREAESEGSNEEEAPAKSTSKTK